MIAASDGEEIRAIVDWELCTLGDPLADLGGLLAYWPQDDDAGAGCCRSAPAASRAAEVASCTPRRPGATSPRCRSGTRSALWKIAIICEGVRRRALDDERNAARTGIPPAHVVDDLIARAEALL